MSLPRMNHPDAVHLITNRCEHGMSMMRPTPPNIDLIKFWLAKAVSTKGPNLDIFAFCFLPNHFHIVLRDPKGELAAFMLYFQSNIAKSFNKKIGRSGHFWSREYDDVIVDGTAEFWNRYAYTTLNAVSSNLVSKGRDWKGLSSYQYALNHTPITGKGINRTRYSDARRRNKSVDIKQFEETFSFELATPPMIEHLTNKRQTDYLANLFESATARYRNKHANCPPLGMQTVLRHPVQKPRPAPKERPRFKFMSFTPKRLKQLKADYRLFVAAYNKCIRIWRKRLDEGGKTISIQDKFFWPAGCYPPTAHHPIGAC